MIRRFGCFLGMVLWGVGVAHARPRIAFEKTDYDFGVLVEGSTAAFSFPFKNTGGDPLEILAVAASCGCTAAAPADRVVGPGKKSEIRVVYDSHNRLGVTQKTVRVQTNDPRDPVAQLFVRGMVVPVQHPTVRMG
ncbi:MAG TPA: DUF1573 domain-containing protein, partial [Elusimicrobiota bacterium]|nr:DUF1573 domain-containing protein [Elusimicrobiota bacterium]